MNRRSLSVQQFDMTTVALVTHSAVDTNRRAAVVELARIETFTMLRRASVWLGLVLSIVLLVTGALAEESWSSQKYQSLVPLTLFPMTITTFVAGVRSGNRDRSRDRPALAEEAPLGGDDRTLARIASLIVPVGFAAPLMLAVGVGSRIEGGFAVDEGRFLNDNAMHSIFELLQPLLAIAVVGALAVAIGRWVRRSGPAIVIGVVVFFMIGSVYWVWNIPPAHTTALMQVQPFDIADRDIVHIPTVIFHDLYLVGLAGLFAGLALRGGVRRPLVVGGLAVAVISVAAQFAVSPF